LKRVEAEKPPENDEPSTITKQMVGYPHVHPTENNSWTKIENTSVHCKFRQPLKHGGGSVNLQEVSK